MTSKEAIDELIDCAKFDLNKWELDRLGIIDRDLEILELIRKYMYFDAKDNSCIKMFDIKECITNIDFEIITDWLENEKVFKED